MTPRSTPPPTVPVGEEAIEDAAQRGGA
jgi:hypothetical protein